MEREAAEALDHKTDDEKTGTGDYSEHEDYGGVDDRASAPPYSASAPLKRGRSTSPHPAPLPKKNKNARKHKKAHYVRAERREREGHVPRPKVVQRNAEAGTSFKTGLESEGLPAAHGAYVAKNITEADAKKKHSPADLDAMGFECIPWHGL